MPRTVDDNQSRKMWRRFSRRTKMVIKFPHEGYRLFHSCANTSGNDLPKTRTNCYCFNFHIIPCINWPYFSIFQFQHLCPWNPCLFGHQYGPLRQRRVFQRLSSPLQAQKVTRWHRHGCHGKANRSNKNFLVKRDTWHYHQLLNARNHSNKKKNINLWQIKMRCVTPGVCRRPNPECKRLRHQPCRRSAEHCASDEFRVHAEHATGTPRIMPGQQAILKLAYHDMWKQTNNLCWTESKFEKSTWQQNKIHFIKPLRFRTCEGPPIFSF